MMMKTRNGEKPHIQGTREEEEARGPHCPPPHPADTPPMALRYKTLSSEPEHQSMAELTSRDLSTVVSLKLQHERKQRLPSPSRATCRAS